MGLRLVGGRDAPWEAQAVGESGAAGEREAFLRQLIARVAHEDEAALELLYRQLNHTIYAFALRRLSDGVAADEIVVETMYEVWRYADRFAARSRVTTWVLGIARHKLLDHLRRRGADTSDPLGEEAEAIPDERPDAYVLLAQRQEAQQIALCMETLPSEQRECLHLVFYEDLSLAEISELQGCPENTVKTRLFHARRKMKECLQRQISR